MIKGHKKFLRKCEMKLQKTSKVVFAILILVLVIFLCQDNATASSQSENTFNNSTPPATVSVNTVRQANPRAVFNNMEYASFRSTPQSQKRQTAGASTVRQTNTRQTNTVQQTSSSSNKYAGFRSAQFHPTQQTPVASSVRQANSRPVSLNDLEHAYSRSTLTCKVPSQNLWESKADAARSSNSIQINPKATNLSLNNPRALNLSTASKASWDFLARQGNLGDQLKADINYILYGKSDFSSRIVAGLDIFTLGITSNYIRTNVQANAEGLGTFSGKRLKAATRLGVTAVGIPGVGGAALAAAVPAATTIYTLASTTGGGVTLTTLSQAAAAYGEATIATLPAWVPTTLAIGTSTLTIGGTAYGAYDCGKTGGTGSACQALVTTQMANPAGFTEAINSSLTTISNIAKNAASRTITKIAEKAWGAEMNVTHEYPNGETWNPFNKLKDQAVQYMEDNPGATAEEAAATVMRWHRVRSVEEIKILRTDPLFVDDSLAQKCYSGTANCFQQSKLVQQLIKELGGGNTRTIYGLGGDFPLIHVATSTDEGYIPFAGGLYTDENQFFRFVQRQGGKWGNFRLLLPQTSASK